MNIACYFKFLPRSVGSTDLAQLPSARGGNMSGTKFGLQFSGSVTMRSSKSIFVDPALYSTSKTTRKRRFSPPSSPKFVLSRTLIIFKHRRRQNSNRIPRLSETILSGQYNSAACQSKDPFLSPELNIGFSLIPSLTPRSNCCEKLVEIAMSDVKR